MNNVRAIVSVIVLAIVTFVLGNLSSQYWSIQPITGSQGNGLSNDTSKSIIPLPKLQIQAQPVAAAPTPTSQQSLTKIGDSVVVDGMKYTVLSATNFGNDLSKYGGIGSTKGKFVEVKFRLENVGQQENDQVILAVQDSAGRQYRASLDGGYLNLNGYDTYNGGYDPIKAGFSQKLLGVFEISSDSANLQLLVLRYNEQVAAHIVLGL